MTGATFSLAIVSVALNALAQIALRKTMLGLGALPAMGADLLRVVLGLAFNPWFLAGMACYVVSIGCWMLVLAKTEVSLAYPLLSIGYVIAAVIGFLFLAENVTPQRIAGIAVICLGIVLISRSG